MIFSTITQNELTLSVDSYNLPTQNSNNIQLKFVQDTENFSGYTPTVAMALLDSALVSCADVLNEGGFVPLQSDGTFLVQNNILSQDGFLAVAINLTKTTGSTTENVMLGPVVYKIQANVSALSPLPPDDNLWQSVVTAFLQSVYDNDYKPQFDQIQQDLENLVTEAQQQQQTAEQQQTQIDNAISVMGEYQIVSNDPVQIQFKQGDGTFGPTVDLGDGLASKSMVNAGYYQSIGTEYSGAASDYGIQVEEIVGAYSQGSNPSPDNPQEMQAVEISELKSSGRNMFDYQSIVDEATEAGLSTNAVLEEKEGRNCLKINAGERNFRLLRFLKGRFKENTQYKFYMTGYYEGTGTGLFFQIKYTDGSQGYKAFEQSNSFSNIEILSASGKTVDSIFFSFGNINTTWLDLDSSYIVELSEDTGEFPGRFVGDTITLSEPLILRALPNGVCDVYNRSNTDKVKRWIYEDIFNGSSDENWSKNSDSFTNVVRFSIAPKNNASGLQILCDKFPFQEGANDTEHIRLTGGTPPSITLYINKSRLQTEDVNGLKTWLQSNPITIWYQLATPTTEQLAIPTLQSFYPFTNAWCDSVVQPQQITWNVLTGKSSILDGNGNLIQQGYMTPQDNLLINSDFASGIINQRGQTNYVGQSTWNYGIDMWKIINCGINVESGDINVFSTSGGYMSQNVEGGLGENDYTAAVYVSLLNSGNAFMYLEGTGKTDEYEISEPGLHVYTFKNVTQGSGLSFKFSKGFNGNINFVKLEKGSTFTGMPPWNYALEYLKCCRYLYVWYLPEIPSHGYNSINNLSYFTGTAFPVPFLSAPTWTVKQLLMDQVDVSSDLNTINVTPNRCTSISLTGQISTISGTIIFSNELS